MVSRGSFTGIFSSEVGGCVSSKTGIFGSRCRDGRSGSVAIFGLSLLVKYGVGLVQWRLLYGTKVGIGQAVGELTVY